MDSESDSDKKNDSDTMSGDRDVPEPLWIRHTSIQANSIDKRLLEYNVRSLWVGLGVILIVFCFL